jgi:SpoVK/Ycf46/Vps4 family AAA+-type ATPase
MTTPATSTTPTAAAHPLSPAQQQAFDAIVDAAQSGRCAVLSVTSGNGRTTILHAAHAQLGGAWIGADEIQRALARKHPLAGEDALYDLITGPFAEHRAVFVDDIDLALLTLEHHPSYERMGMVRVAMKALAERARAAGVSVIVGTNQPFESLGRLGRMVHLKELTIDDYRAVMGAYLATDDVARCDFAKIRRFAKHLTARTLMRAAIGARDRRVSNPSLDITDAVIEYLRAAQLVSNVDLGEVQSVKLEDLRGLDDVLHALEANVILPLEHSELATELSLKAKRGVLLVGPPGTGKTTIGRALAHRLRGKFFLVDGTMIAGTGAFYQQLHHVFQAAMHNAPSVVFIDDSDVIFEGEDPGLYRYLLTMLDGLESESAAGVCLMMTAMDVASLPPALVRSGRIELWLETRLPDAAARTALLTDLCAKLPASLGRVDIEQLVAATEQLSGADLKRVVEDGKLLYAFDRAKGTPKASVTDYFIDALATVRGNKVRYAEAEARARSRQPTSANQIMRHRAHSVLMSHTVGLMTATSDDS